MFRLARELPPPVFVSVSTHLAVSQLALADRHIQLEDPAELDSLEAGDAPAVTLFTGNSVDSDRVIGIPLDRLDRLIGFARTRSIPILIEADGSRLRPLKAPADHEPSIPPSIDQVVVMVGLSGLGKPLNADWVHRPELFAKLSGANLGEPVNAAHICRVFLHSEGGLKGIPAQARRVALFNQADEAVWRGLADQIAGQLIPAYAAVVFSSLKESSTVYAVRERVAGILLAAGASTRIGRPKQLLNWRREPLVKHVARAALDAGLSPVIVVTGSSGDLVGNALSDLQLGIVDNPNWKSGQASSVQTGLNALPANTGSVVFLLADQPQIPPDLVRALIEKHTRTLAPVIAPRVEGQRGNPVLFDRSTFPDLLALEGDTGGRAIFSRDPIEWIDWDDHNLLLDVDSEADYERLLQLPE